MCVETAACQARVFGAMLCMIGSPGNSHPHWVHLERERERNLSCWSLAGSRTCASDESRSTEECFQAVAERMLGEKKNTHTHTTVCVRLLTSPRAESMAMWSSGFHPLATSLSTSAPVCFCTCLCDRLGSCFSAFYSHSAVCIILCWCPLFFFLFFYSSACRKHHSRL